MVPACSVKVPRVSTYSGYRCAASVFAYGAFTLSGRLSQSLSANLAGHLVRSEPQHARTLVWALPVPLAATPGITVVFSSSGYLDVSVRRVPSSMPMCSAWGGGVFPRRVSPFRHPRIDGYVPLPAAFRSLSRLSSAPGAKASALCPSLLNRLLPAPRLAWRFLGSSRALARLLWIPVPCAAPMGALPPASRRHFSLLDVRWGLPHRLVLFVSIRFSRYSWRPLPPMGLSGLEPPTSRLSGVRSNRLSYKPFFLLLFLLFSCFFFFFLKSGSLLLSHA